MLRKFGPTLALARNLGVLERQNGCLFQISRLSISSRGDAKNKDLAKGFLQAFKSETIEDSQPTKRKRKRAGKRTKKAVESNATTASKLSPTDPPPVIKPITKIDIPSKILSVPKAADPLHVIPATKPAIPATKPETLSPDSKVSEVPEKPKKITTKIFYGSPKVADPLPVIPATKPVIPETLSPDSKVTGVPEKPKKTTAKIFYGSPKVTDPLPVMPATKPVKPATEPVVSATKPVIPDNLSPSSNASEMVKPQRVQTSEPKSLFSDLFLSALTREEEIKPGPSDIHRMKSLLSSLAVENQEKGEIEDEIIRASKEMMSYRATGKMNKKFVLVDKTLQQDLTSTSFTNFLTGTRLNIFDKEIMNGPVQKDVFVSILEKENSKKVLELSEISNNGFEEMLKNADKMWQFPVDNEVVKVEERDVGFEEHIFLEDYIDDFPDAEPVRRFMELVITGLQKNAYISAKEKKQHILWFKDYFEQFPHEDLDFS